MKKPLKYKVTISGKKLNSLCNLTSVKELETVKHILYERNATSMKQCIDKYGAYPYIPMSSRHVLSMFLALKKWIKQQSTLKNPLIKNKTEYKFLDAGSGIGNILLLASLADLSTRYVGIEFNKPTLEASTKVLSGSKKKFKVVYGDIITYKRYSDFDIMYYYCPLHNHILEIYFEELLEDEAGYGAILICEMKRSSKMYKDNRFIEVNLQIPVDNTEIKSLQYNETNFLRFYIKTSTKPRTYSALTENYKWKEIPEKYKARITKHVDTYA